MSFVSGVFLFGLFGALGPLVIHLINRRQQKTIQWAAMDLLLQAVREQHRRIQLRDLLLLILRTAAIVFFILAMAQPFWKSDLALPGAGQPVHAVIVVDNSLSMSYTPFDLSLLDLAKEKIKKFILTLPSGSGVTLIPMCSQRDARFAKVYDSVEDSLEAVERIHVVDRMALLDKLPVSVGAASRQQGTVPFKRIVIISDMQKQTWKDSFSAALEKIKKAGDVQLVEIGPADGQIRQNSWIESAELRGGYAESSIPAMFDITIRHQSNQNRNRIRVSLSVAGKIVQDKHVDLIANQLNHVSFEHVIEKPGGEVNPVYLPVRIEMEHDRLSRDDFLTFVIPVFKRAPVLFVDQYGALEDPEHNRYGESYPLRRIVSAKLALSHAVEKKILPSITINEITNETLENARLVVISGVRSPSPSALTVLRSYVEKGGQIMLTAGAGFSPSEWTSIGWNEGRGILPVPLASEFIGGLPNASASSFSKFHLDPVSFRNDVFALRVSENQWNQLLLAPFFYRAVRIDKQASAQSESLPTDNDKAQVIGRYDNGEPFALMRRIKKGNVILVTTGCFPVWNNLAVTPQGSILIYDQMIRWLVNQSISKRTFTSRQELVVSVAPRDQNSTYLLHSPGSKSPVPLSVEAVGENEFAVVARRLGRRGAYSIRKTDSGPGMNSAADQFTFAVNGPSEESDLMSVNQNMPESFPSVQRLKRDGSISLSGESSGGQDLWGYLMLLALLCLFAEMVIISAPSFKRLIGKEAV